MSESKKIAFLELIRPADKQGNALEPIHLVLKAMEDIKYDEIDAWLQNEYMKAARRWIRADSSVSAEDRAVELQLAQRTASGLSMLSGEGARQMSTPKGLAKLIYEHCEELPLTLEELRKLLFNPINVDAVNAAIEKVNLDADEVKKLAEEAKRTAKKSRALRKQKAKQLKKRQKHEKKLKG